MATITFKVKHYDKSVSRYKFDSDKDKKVAQMIGRRVMEDVMVGAAPKIARRYKYTVAQHNRRAIMEAAIYFQRVVSRTPRDEHWYDPETKKSHAPDKDYIWKAWTIKYGRSSITSAEMGEDLFDEFNDKYSINIIAEKLTLLYGGHDVIANRKTRIKNIRIENLHPRFAMLEYGTYVPPDGSIKTGKERGLPHGKFSGYSIQAPYGMERITRAEMAAFTPEMLDNYFGTYGSVEAENEQVPTGEQMKALRRVMMQNGILKRHLSPKDIEKIAEVMDR